MNIPSPSQNQDTIKHTRTVQIFKVILFGNKALYEKVLFFIFHSFPRVESPPLCLYHQLHDTLYIKVVLIFLDPQCSDLTLYNGSDQYKNNTSKDSIGWHVNVL